MPVEILYDRMKTAVTGEDGEGHIVYNRSLLVLAQLYGFLPKACRPYRAKTKGKVERPFRYLARPQLLVVDEIGYLPAVPGGGNLFFQLVNARYERGAMILTSNRGFAERTPRKTSPNRSLCDSIVLSIR